MIRKSFFIFGSIAAVVSIIFMVIWLINAGVFSSGPVMGPLPPQVTHVMPTDGEHVSEVYGFCVHFDYQGGNGMGDEPQESIRYILDGRNVTEHMHDLISLEYPTQVAEPCYRSSKPLKSGWHTAKVTYEDISGVHFEYKWRFQVVNDE